VSDLKTLLDWIRELPEPFQTQAMAYVNPENMTRRFETQSNAIVTCIATKRTTQGLGYWTCVAHGNYPIEETLRFLVLDFEGNATEVFAASVEIAIREFRFMKGSKQIKSIINT
jgi:hypothetical protein